MILFDLTKVKCIFTAMDNKELKSILKERGIKQTWVAEKLSVTKSLVNQWVNEVNEIPEKYRVELKHLLK